MNRHQLWLCLTLLFTVPAVAQDEDDELPSGLLATYSTTPNATTPNVTKDDEAAKGHTVQRVDPDIAFVWGNAAPDERLIAGPFRAEWSGRILLRGEGRTRWHAFVQGKVEVRIDGKIVVVGETEQPAWLSGDEVELGFGEKPFSVKFTRTGDAAQLKLFWSSNEFPLEPLPYHFFFHEKPSPEIALAERGRVQFEAFRCANCHGGVDGRGLKVDGHTKTAADSQPSTFNPQPSFPAPSLKHVGQGTSREWLLDKLMAGELSGHRRDANEDNDAEKTPHPNPLPGPPKRRCPPGRGDQNEEPTAGAGRESKMPHFGFARDEAEAIVAALFEQAQPVKLDAPPKLKDSERDKDLKEGRTLIRSVGCLACHTHDTLGEVTPFGGGSLTDIGQRRSADWLATWLAKPTQVNEHARMPVVSLSDKERAQIVLALFSPLAPAGTAASVVRGERPGVRGPDDEQTPESKAKTKDSPHPNPLPAKPGRGDKAEGKAEGKATTLPTTARGEGTGKEDPAQVARGRTLIETSRCSACHEFASSRPLVVRPRSLARGDLDWMKSCLTVADKASGRPHVPQVEAKAIQAYVASWSGRDPSPLAINDQPSTLNQLTGHRLLEQKNCLACHDRDESKGLSRLAASIAKADESLAGLHMTLIPPRLNAVGDRMRDEALVEAISGAPKSPRLSWLRVRMPRFQHTDAEKSALMAYLVGHDRIPVGQPKTSPLTLTLSPEDRGEGAGSKPDPQRLLAGRELLGGKGFSCVACHAVKDYTPKVTALGTRGSNLHLLGQRMRTDYYFRWTRAPLRIMPGVEMPNYQRPHQFILPGQLDQQLTAIWEALNDPNLTAPTNPAVVEQLLTIGQGERPRIVRDVFTVPGGEEGETVARAFAIGFDNGHSALFDLETGGVRAWTLGDFARQRCEGKRWYWDLAGTVLGSRFDKRPDILFLNSKTSEVVAPETGWHYELELLSHDDHWLHYQLRLSKGDATHDVKVSEGFMAINDASGWERHVTVFNPKESPLVPWHRGAKPETLHETARLEWSVIPKERPASLPANARPFAVHDRNNKHPLYERFVTTIRYKTSLGRVEAVNPNPPAPPLISEADRITSVPGFRGERLPLPRSIMPTAMTFDDKSRLIFTSLKGHVYRVDVGEVVALSQSEGQPQAVLVPSPPSSGERARVRGPNGKDASQPQLAEERTPHPHPNPLPSKARGEGTNPKKPASSVTLTTLTEGLAAPFGLLWKPQEPSGKYPGQPILIVAHKPELLKLVLKDDTRVHEREVLSTGWGLTDDYHDWTCGIAKDSKGNLFIGLASDYTFKNRPKEKSRWRGDVLRIDPAGKIESIARGLRYPTGLAIDDQDRLFVTDQQGVQNTFNELNYIQPGHRYGVPSRHEPEPDAPADPPAVQIPHPWTRSVNGVVFVPRKRESKARSQKSESGQPQADLVPSPPSSGERVRVRGPSGEQTPDDKTEARRTPHPNPLPSKARGEGTGGAASALDPRPSTLDSLAGHFLAAEYNNNSIIRMSIQDVDGIVQGAVYPFSKPTSDEAPLSATPGSGGKPVPQDSSSFIGPICIGISPSGDIYVGGFQDGGWAGGLNMGDIVKLTPEGDFPNGLREVRATARGFDLEFFHPVDPELARQMSHYKISGYTRVWKGDYATPDSGRHNGDVTDAKLDDAGRTVSLTVTGLKPGHVYDVSVGEIGRADQRILWPSLGHYTLHRIPK